MARIVQAVIGSFGDLHPHMALGLALRERGHQVVLATSSVYTEKVLEAGLAYHPLRPDVAFADKELLSWLLHPRYGPQHLVRDWLMPQLRDTYADLADACAGADALISSDVVFAAPILSEAAGLPWASLSLAPITYLSAHDP